MRQKYIAIEYQDWGDGWREVDEVAADLGLSGEGRQLSDAVEWGQFAVRVYPVSRSRRRAEEVCDLLSDYITKATSLSWIVYVHPPLPHAVRRVRAFLSLLRQVARQPPGMERDENLYLLKYDLTALWRFLNPFERCDCGGFTKILWRVRDPHYRNGKWVGPDDCLPF